MFSLKKLKGYSDISSLKDARWAIQHEYAKEKGYPLWSLKYSTSEYNTGKMQQLIDDVIKVVSDPESMKNPQLLNSTISGYEEQKLEWGNLLIENNGGNYKEGFDNFLKGVDIVNLQDSEIPKAMDYLQGHLEGEVGLWKELEVREKLKDWRISQQKPAGGDVIGGGIPTSDGGGSTDGGGFIVVGEQPVDIATKRSELADKVKMIPSNEIKEIISEIIEKENGYILDVLLKYVQ
jgi:hypothetical protein